MKSGMEPRRQAIPVLLLVKTAFQLLWQQRDDALRLGLVPTLMLFGGLAYGDEARTALMVVLQAGTTEIPVGIMTKMMILSAVILVAASLLTVNWLRFLLIGPMGAVGIGLTIGSPHIRFLLAVFALSFGLPAALVALLRLLSFLPAVFAVSAALLFLAAALVVIVRSLPYLTGVAIGQTMSLAQSWRVSRGNSLALATSLVLLQVPFMLGLLALQIVLDSTGFTALAPIGTLFIYAIVHVAVWICQAGVLATAYRHMVGVRV